MKKNISVVKNFHDDQDNEVSKNKKIESRN